MLRVVAAGVGDGLVAVFDPCHGNLKTLIKPRQYDRGTQFTPFSVTEKLVGESLQCTHIVLPSGSLIFRMTDGAWEGLPHLCSEPLIDQKSQKRYLEYSLDDVVLGKKLTAFIQEYPQASVSDYCTYLQGMIQQTIEAQKIQLVAQRSKILHQLEEFQGAANSTLGDFITCQSDPQFHTLFDSFLDTLNLVKNDLHKLPLSALEDQLKHVNLGDDITLHVERALYNTVK